LDGAPGPYGSVVASGRAASLGERLRNHLTVLAEQRPTIGEVRGMGAMLAIELVRDRRTREPAPEQARAIITAARNRGLLLLSAGTYGNVIRFLMPLTIGDEVLDEGVAILDAAFSDASEATHVPA